MALQLFREDVTEKCPDDRNPPQVLELFSDQWHGLIQTAENRRQMRDSVRYKDLGLRTEIMYSLNIDTMTSEFSIHMGDKFKLHFFKKCQAA